MCGIDMGSFFSADMLGKIGNGLQIGGVASKVFGAYEGAKAEIDALTYNAAVLDNNATLAEYGRKDALARGEEEAMRSRRATNAARGKQVASMAARGLDISEGSALNLLTDTDLLGEEDVAIIKNNAAKEAWGYGIERDNYSREAQMARNRGKSISPLGAAGSTLLTGAGQVASRWYRKQAGDTKKYS